MFLARFHMTHLLQSLFVYLNSELGQTYVPQSRNRKATQNIKKTAPVVPQNLKISKYYHFCYNSRQEHIDLRMYNYTFYLDYNKVLTVNEFGALCIIKLNKLLTANESGATIGISRCRSPSWACTNLFVQGMYVSM